MVAPKKPQKRKQSAQASQKIIENVQNDEESDSEETAVSICLTMFVNSELIISIVCRVFLFVNSVTIILEAY